jgi:hypothetical protein
MEVLRENRYRREEPMRSAGEARQSLRFAASPWDNSFSEL